MGIDFGSLIIDLEALACGSKEDFVNEFWSSYETYIKTYNRLLKDLQTLGFYKKLAPIEEVPFSDQSFDHGFTKQEKAKLREVANASNSLLQKVRLLLSPPAPDRRLNSQVRSNKIFIVHGQDNEMASDVVQTLEKLELEPVILHGEPDSKKTLTEKTGEYPHVSFAVVVLSPDDLGHPKEETNRNIILELGYSLGLLGTQNVAAVYPKNSDSKLPNTYSDVLWIPYTTGWYLKLIRQLQDCNFDVDANKLGWL